MPTLPSGLTHLGLGYNRLDSVSGLANLTGLQVLVLDGNRLASLAGLSGKTALQQLYLRGNKSASGVALSDISLLSGLSPTNLTTLELGSNNISDIAPLASLKALAGAGRQQPGNAAALSGMAGWPT
ncbi:MAG: leucine-rich repeat domain-containing protein [Candidatus Thiothrix singaporensis]|uniref:Leucine-rich repeat domain-containing protein n=1 Tax=Candidatus Thiothrix singaporensis TaxID=2799669 RepID=A0A7L6ANM5_9GAMM|nr:MAG: leucine-rich repeat domain-containing protein [Candidatus Thiothrix singaporensis]